MMLTRNKLPSMLLILGLLPPFAFANVHFANKNSIEYFASNNTNEIDLLTAFNRLQGKEQQQLQNDTISVMQKEHLEQSQFENLLGTYKMTSSQNTTADNTEKLITSAYQQLSTEKIFRIAKELANSLKQESIAVFVPINGTVGDTILHLKSQRYTIDETIKIIREKLPAEYNQAFSLHLAYTDNTICYSFDHAIVNEVEWLGSSINAEDIKKVFPQEDIDIFYGKAYLVYKNGQIELL